jgi:hypothetical protein
MPRQHISSRSPEGNVTSRAHPAGGRRTPPPAPANTRKSRVERPALAQIPAYSRSARKRQDRPVTPEVAGSSPVAPAFPARTLCESACFVACQGADDPSVFIYPAYTPHGNRRRKPPIAADSRNSDCRSIGRSSPGIRTWKTLGCRRFPFPWERSHFSSRASDSKEHLTATERLGEPRSAGPLLKAGHVRHGGCHTDLVLTARDDRASSISERRPRC